MAQTSERTIGSPALQENALANSAMFDGAPIARKRSRGCSLVFVTRRANSGRSLVGPDAPEGQEESLVRREARDLLGLGLALEALAESVVGDLQAAEVGDRLAEDELSVDVADPFSTTYPENCFSTHAARAW